MTFARIGVALVAFTTLMVSPALAVHARDQEDACRGVMNIPIDDAIGWCSLLIRGAPLVDERQNGPWRYNIIYLRALAYAAKQDHEHAVEDFSTVIRFLPDRANAYFYRARSLIALGRAQEAEQDKAAYAKLRPNGNRFVEDCSPVDWQAVETVKSLGDWAVTQPGNPSGRVVLLNYGGNKEMAERATALIKHKRYDRRCYIGRPYPPMGYWMSAGSLAKHEAATDGECSVIDNASLGLARKDGALQIMDKQQTLLVTGYDDLISQQVLAVLRALKPTRKCTIRVEDEELYYWTID